MRVEESIEIGRPPEAVWDVVSDPSNDPRWCPKISSVQADGPGRWTVMHRPVPLRPPLALTLEDVEAERPAGVRRGEEDETWVFVVEYRLDPTATGTCFTQTSDFEWKRLPRWLQRLFARGVRRDVRAQLRALQDEVDPAPAGQPQGMS